MWLDGREVVEYLLVGRRRGVVERVDDHHVEVIGREVSQPAGAQALDRGVDVLEPCRLRAADPLLAEGGVAQGVAEGGEALVEDLLAVGDEKQAGAGEPRWDGRRVGKEWGSTGRCVGAPVS